jgi:hypothetical protein
MTETLRLLANSDRRGFKYDSEVRAPKQIEQRLAALEIAGCIVSDYLACCAANSSNSRSHRIALLLGHEFAFLRSNPIFILGSNSISRT